MSSLDEISFGGSSYRHVPEPVKAHRTMIVTAALCWWNERPADLIACIEGAAKIADRVVALDGAYRRYPGATIASDPAQAKAIRAACAKAGLDCLVVTPDRLWAGQIEKRSLLLAMAAVGSEWIVTLDADHIIQTDREAVRNELYNSTADVVDVPFITPKDRKRGNFAAGQWHLAQADGPQMIPQVWRASLQLSVERHHWWVSGIQNGQKVWAWAGDETRRKLPHAAFVTPYTVEHRTLLRSEKQVLASRAFCNDREMVVARTGQEDDLPTLPRPVFDYVTVPI
jgi:hypothetical protein